MELVYLWVEKYKNIEKQWFNFSPNFECEFKDEYDKDEKLKDNCKVTIKPKENSIKDFFGKNINITAIVGENGSGKSNLVKCLGNIFNVNKRIVYFINDTLFTNFPLNSINNKTKYKIEKTDDGLDNIIFSNRNFLMEKTNTSILSSLYLENSNLYLKYFDFDKYKLTLNINSFYEKILKNILVKNYRTTFFNPKRIGIYFNYTSKEYLGSKKIKEKNNIEEFKSRYKIYLKSLEISEMVNSNDKEELRSSQTRIMTEFLNSSEKEILSYDYAKYDGIKSSLLIDKDENIYNFLYKYFVDKEIRLLRDKGFSFEEVKKLEFLKTTEDVEVFFYLNRIGFLEYDFFDDKKSFSSLSSGEKSFFSDMVILSKEIEEFLKYKEDKNSLFLILDEPETTFHPQWQKTYINEIIYFINNFKGKKTHLILTSHSPFILSDIPKENVIFLEKDKETGNCKNVSDEMKDFKTFGANIHTLLSNGFFMKDGLMGEFAKNKINEIKDFYDKNKDLKVDSPNFKEIKQEFEKNKANFKNIQKIIGEPFLQTIIKNYLDELEVLFYGKKEFLDKELAELEKRKIYLESLKNAKD